MGKKNLMQFSGAACSPVSIRSLICDIHLVLTIQGDGPWFCPSSPAMIHQEKQGTLGTENLDMQLWLIPPSSRTELERYEKFWEEHLEQMALELYFLFLT